MPPSRENLPGEFVDDRPRHTESVTQHAEATGVERLLHRHEDLSTVGKKVVNSLCLLRGIDREIKVCTAHFLEMRWRNIVGDQHRVANLHSRVNDRLAGPSGCAWRLA